MIKKPPIFRDVTPNTMYWYLPIKCQDTKYADYWLMKLPKQFLKWGYAWRSEHILMDFLVLLSVGRSRINVETEPMTFCCGKGVAVVVLLQNILGLGVGWQKQFGGEVAKICLGGDIAKYFDSLVTKQFGEQGKPNFLVIMAKTFEIGWQKNV